MVLPCPKSSNFVDIQKAVEWLQQQGWEIQVLEETNFSVGEQLQNSFLNGTIAPPEVKAHIYPNLELEVRGTLAQVKNLLSKGTPANEIVLVARDDAFYGPTVLSAFNSAVEWQPLGLPEQYLPLLAPKHLAFIREGERIVAHGGASVEELVVPFIHVEF